MAQHVFSSKDRSDRIPAEKRVFCDLEIFREVEIQGDVFKIFSENLKFLAVTYWWDHISPKHESTVHVFLKEELRINNSLNMFSNCLTCNPYEFDATS